MSTPVDLTADEPFGRPVEVFDGDFLTDNTGHAGYAVDPTGEYFYLSAERYDIAHTQIQLVLNSIDELERLIPEE